MSMKKEGLSQHTETGQATAIRVNTGITNKIQCLNQGRLGTLVIKVTKGSFAIFPRT